MQKYDSKYLPTWWALSLSALLTCTSLSWGAERAGETPRTDKFGVTHHPSIQSTPNSVLLTVEQFCGNVEQPLRMTPEVKACYSWWANSIYDSGTAEERAQNRVPYFHYLPEYSGPPNWSVSCKKLSFQIKWTENAIRFGYVNPMIDFHMQQPHQQCAQINQMIDEATPQLQAHWRSEDLQNLGALKGPLFQGNASLGADTAPGRAPGSTKRFHDQLRKEGIEKPLPPK